jgi:hypothetical protein
MVGEKEELLVEGIQSLLGVLQLKVIEQEVIKEQIL